MARLRRRSGWIPAFLLPVFMLALAVAGCAPQAASPAGSGSGGGGERLKVVATTSIVGDVVGHVGGEAIDLSLLLPAGTDPHSYEPAPQDIALVADADLVFANGAGLETFLQLLLENAGGETRIVEVSEGVPLLEGAAGEHADEAGGHADEALADEGLADEHNVDPHTWTSPRNVVIWTEVIEKALSEADPAHAALYKENAGKYRQALEELDAWIREQVAAIPVEDRLLLCDHDMLAYFAREYGFTLAGAVIPNFSTLAEPSAQELAQLEDRIQALGVKAVFVDASANQSLARRVAADTGILLVPVYGGSLSGAGGEADHYLDYMRYNVAAIVNALK